MKFKITYKNTIAELRIAFLIAARRKSAKSNVFSAGAFIVLAGISVWSFSNDTSNLIPLFILAGGAAAMWLVFTTPRRKWLSVEKKFLETPPTKITLKFYENRIEICEGDADEGVNVGRNTEEVYFREYRDFYLLTVNKLIILPIPKREITDEEVGLLSEYFS